jgi:uncharacterized RDD family membrane protein YckC/predicted nucleic-acid-binding Zn-ribbon protein
MSTTFICEKCGNTTFEQMTYTQAKCLQCGYLNLYDSGFKGQREFQLSPEKDLLNLESKTILVPAPFIKRFVNYLADSLFMAFIIVLVALLLNIDLLQLETKIIQMSSIAGLSVYYLFTEYFFGKTIGKKFTKTRVVSLDGNRLTFGQCLLRTVCRIIPFDFLTGFLFNGLFLHDSLAKTMVIED